MKQTPGGHIVRWRRDRVEFRIDSELRRALPQGQAVAAASTAVEAWRGYDGVPDLVITDGVAPARDDWSRSNGIYLVRDWPFARDALAVTLTTYDARGWILGVDVLVNGNHELVRMNDEREQAKGESYDLAAILTHEMGHVLGLDETLDDPEATMWPEISPGDSTACTLTDDDIDGALAIYAESDPRTPACSAARPGSAGGRPAGWVLFAVIVVIARTRSRRR